jgi:hypothetical protein
MNPKLIVINGKTYNSVDEMPEDVRKQYEGALLSKSSVGFTQDEPLPVSQTIAPDTSNGWMPTLVRLLDLLLCIALAIIGWMAFLR